MRVCLVYPDVGGVDQYGARKYYHGLGYISSFLKAHGHEVSLIYLEAEPEREPFLAELARHSPDVVAFSTTTQQHPFAEQCARWIKATAPEIVTVAGGTHPTLAPERVMANHDIDFISTGEGEFPMLRLVERLEKGEDASDLQGFWVRKGDQILRNPGEPLIEDLDIIPYADRELFDFATILARNGGWVDMMAGRGCPYQCSYCANPGLLKKFRGLGKYVRYRSVENVLGEIEQIVTTYKVTTLNFQDDVFTLDHDWTRAFCEAYKKRFKIPFWVNTRVERVQEEEIVRMLAEAGCTGIRVGLESGNEQLRKNILKRRMSNQLIRDTFALVKKYGMETYTCNMIGVPGETLEMIKETIDLNRELTPSQLQFSVFHPYPMTELHDIAIQKGLYDPKDSLPSYYGRESVLKLDTLTKNELYEAYDRFVELKRELALKRRSPMKHKIYTFLRTRVYNDDTLRLRRHLTLLGYAKPRNWRKAAREIAGRLARRNGSGSRPSSKSQEPVEMCV
jgi:anaerobic magnesium-protoporphyrin IX monomethyl ester cyclase